MIQQQQYQHLRTDSSQLGGGGGEMHFTFTKDNHCYSDSIPIFGNVKYPRTTRQAELSELYS